MTSRALKVAVVALLLASAVPTVQPAAQQAGSLRIYLARHGQTDGNLNRRVQGWTDTPLNATGREQAQALARAIGSVPFDAIFSSTRTPRRRMKRSRCFASSRSLRTNRASAS